VEPDVHPGSFCISLFLQLRMLHVTDCQCMIFLSPFWIILECLYFFYLVNSYSALKIQNRPPFSVKNVSNLPVELVYSSAGHSQDFEVYPSSLIVSCISVSPPSVSRTHVPFTSTSPWPHTLAGQ
jgi:hypothetical protein